MSAPILATKLYIPSPGLKVVVRTRLVEQVNDGRRRRLTLVCAPAGFGKTTLISAWAAGREESIAWLSLDKGDNDPRSFLIYVIAALRTTAGDIGRGLLSALESPQPPAVESILASLVNEIDALPDDIVLVLDDYHAIEAKPVHEAVAYLLEHLPAQMHLVIATREDPDLPLARLRARGQMLEVRAGDLRFSSAEAAEFLNQVMDLGLSAPDIDALEARTEGWIAGLQLAALSMQGLPDTAGFIKSFTGSHRFVMDYLVEEVLQRQPGQIQDFLLRTAILERLCGPLCDAVLGETPGSGQKTLENLERANLFVVPLDGERQWWRYHHLFADLLRQRLPQTLASSGADPKAGAADLHIRASRWYEDNGLEIEAFHHAAAAQDFDAAERLIEGRGMPLQFRGAAIPILDWLASLPKTVLDARPSLWVTYASATLVTGQVVGVEEKAQAAEEAMRGAPQNDKNRDLIGRIASIRATLAVTRHQVDDIVAQARRALDNLRPENLAVRAGVTWTLGYAYQLKGDRAAAGQTYAQALSLCETIGHKVMAMMAAIGLAGIDEAGNRLEPAAQTYRRALELAGDSPPPPACDAYLGLARIYYEWNDLDAAQDHYHQSAALARQITGTDRLVACHVFLARLKLAEGDVAGAAAILAKAGEDARRHKFGNQLPAIAALQVQIMLRQDDPQSAARLAEAQELPVSQARVHLSRGDAFAALAALEPWVQQVEAPGWEDERLKVMVLQAIAYRAHGKKEKAWQLLSEALALAEPSGLIRTFVDEGAPAARLLLELAADRAVPDYGTKLLAVFEAQARQSKDKSSTLPAQPLINPLSQRELEVLRLLAQGLSNHEISERLFLALSSVKGHNRSIFSKLEVHRRTEAVARARVLGLL